METSASFEARSAPSPYPTTEPYFEGKSYTDEEFEKLIATSD
jgi:hypothetical protein